MPVREIKTKYFRFHQNNSGGSFVIDDARGLGVNVWVEAQSAADANARAESIGIYFNGCDSGADCECCGDRWSSQWRDESGADEPEINQEWDFRWHDKVYVHHIDGTIDRLGRAEAA